MYLRWYLSSYKMNRAEYFGQIGKYTGKPSLSACREIYVRVSLQLSLQMDVFVYSCCSIFSRSSVSKYSPSTIIFGSVWSRYVVFSLLQQHSGTNKNESVGMKRDYWSFKEPNTKLHTNLTANSATGRFVTICRYRAQICQRNASLNSNSL